MVRHYKAFISYRHLPLDMETAIKVHRAIEHYIVPKALRRDGSRRLGYVFRDEDELPISGELTENIRLALENSDYLIVICTPETSKSAWVLKEIETFLSLRDRSRVLLVLADGSPADSFPRAVTELRDENGAVIGEYEPMAANLIADTPSARRRKFKTEILRILAALIGCSFDELYQREKRYQRRRRALLLSLAGLIAALFIGMLLNRNAEISRQLLQSQINEAQTLSALSENAFRKGDISRAVSYALDALPGTGGERPYVPAAEAALWKTLSPYSSSLFSYSASVNQETAIRGMVMSEDGQRVYTGDPYGRIRAFDLNNGACLWSFTAGSGRTIDGAQTIGQDRLLVVYSAEGCSLLSGEDGSVLWERDDLDVFLPRRESESFLALCRDDPTDLQLVDTADGKTRMHFSLRAYDADRVRLAAISPDGSRGAVVLDGNDDFLLLLNLNSGEIRTLPAEIPWEIGPTYLIRFSGQNDLAIARVSRFDLSEIYVFSHRDDWTEQKTVLTDYQYRYSDNFTLSIDVPLFEWSGDALVLGVQTSLRAYNAQSGDMDWSIDLPGNLCAAEVYDNDSFGLVLDNGLVCFSCEGYLYASASWTSFNCSFEVDRALIRGSRYLYSSALVIPREDENRISVIRAPEHDDWELVATSEEDFPESAGPIFSPSGKKLVLFYSDYSTLSGMAFDLEEGSRFAFSIPLPDGYSEKTYESYFKVWDRCSGTTGQFFLTEDFVLMNGPVLFRLREGKADTLPDAEGSARPYDSAYCSAADSAGEHIVTAAADGRSGLLFRWLDDEAQECVPLPEELSSAACCGVGADGRVLLYLDGGDGDKMFYAFSPTAGTCSRLAETEGESGALCFAAGKPLLACVEESGPALYDLESGALLRHFASELPADSVAKLCFARGDSLLIAFSKQSDVLIFDTESGAQLNHVSLSSMGMTMDADSRISVREEPERKLLMIFCYNDLYTESGCVFLDAESLELFDMCCSPIGCDPVSGRLLLMRQYDGLYAAPIYTLEEMTERAAQRIDRRG